MTEAKSSLESGLFMTQRMAGKRFRFKGLAWILSVAILAFSTPLYAAESRFAKPDGTLLLPDGQPLPINIAITPAQRRRGLSGTKESEFPATRGLLFYYFESQEKFFWMPDTYFNLDIIFLDENFKVVAIERNVKAHPGWKEPPAIPRTRRIYSRHVLEIKADSEWGDQIKKGDQLKLDRTSLSKEIVKRIDTMEKGRIKRIELKGNER